MYLDNNARSPHTHFQTHKRFEIEINKNTQHFVCKANTLFMGKCNLIFVLLLLLLLLWLYCVLLSVIKSRILIYIYSDFSVGCVVFNGETWNPPYLQTWHTDTNNGSGVNYRNNCRDITMAYRNFFWAICSPFKSGKVSAKNVRGTMTWRHRLKGNPKTP